MKKFLCCLLCVAAMVVPFAGMVSAEEADAAAPTATGALQLDATSAVLMEYETGKILYEQNPDEKLPPASITKIMTLLLVMEAIDNGKLALDEMVTTSERAAGMGGSQIFLKVGEQMSVRDMVKSVVIASANDAAAALAEHLCGSVEAFVEQMNQKAAALGMENSHFENTNGLDDTTVEHYTSARDVAIMSRALIAHPLILEFSSIWMDSVRNGAFGLTNTNRLVRFYPGATGLKTGSTSKAKFCISATAKRNGMHLIAVVMGSPTRDIRNEEAKKLLDYGFANYALYHADGATIGELPVKGGVQDICAVKTEGYSALIKKEQAAGVTRKIEMPDELTAPIEKGSQIGKISYYAGEELIGEEPIISAEDVAAISFGELFARLLRHAFFAAA